MSMVELYPSEHEIIHDSLDLKCSVCAKQFSNASALRLHRVKSHRVIESEEDKRIYEKNIDGLGKTFIYHCPSEGCMRKDVKFDGMRNLKQHYMRVHTEKQFSCQCGSRFALNKDLLYHKKRRCLERSQPEESHHADDAGTASTSKPTRSKKVPKKRKADKLLDGLRYEERSAEILPVNSNAQPSVSSQPPIILIVPASDVAATIDGITKSLRNTCEVAVQVQAPSMESQHHQQEQQQFLPETNTIAVGEDPPRSFDFGGQFNATDNGMQPGSSYYYQSSNPDVRHTSTGTDFPVASYLHYHQHEEYEHYGYGYADSEQRSDEPAAGGSFVVPPPPPFEAAHEDVTSAAPPMTRSFGTVVDQTLFQSDSSRSVRHVSTGMDSRLSLSDGIIPSQDTRDTQTSLEDLGEDIWRQL